MGAGSGGDPTPALSTVRAGGEPGLAARPYEEVGPPEYEEPRPEFQEPEFLHGCISRADADRALALGSEQVVQLAPGGDDSEYGVFLVREKEARCSWVLSVRARRGATAHHKLELDPPGPNLGRPSAGGVTPLFRLDGKEIAPPCQSLVEVIEHLRRDPTGIGTKRLVTPVAAAAAASGALRSAAASARPASGPAPTAAEEAHTYAEFVPGASPTSSSAPYEQQDRFGGEASGASSVDVYGGELGPQALYHGVGHVQGGVYDGELGPQALYSANPSGQPVAMTGASTGGAPAHAYDSVDRGRPAPAITAAELSGYEPPPVDAAASPLRHGQARARARPRAELVDSGVYGGNSTAA